MKKAKAEAIQDGLEKLGSDCLIARRAGLAAHGRDTEALATKATTSLVFLTSWTTGTTQKKALFNCFWKNGRSICAFLPAPLLCWLVVGGRSISADLFHFLLAFKWRLIIVFQFLRWPVMAIQIENSRLLGSISWLIGAMCGKHGLQGSAQIKRPIWQITSCVAPKISSKCEVSSTTPAGSGRPRTRRLNPEFLVRARQKAKLTPPMASAPRIHLSFANSLANLVDLPGQFMASRG